MQRIAGIRTWTYVSYHGDWLVDAPYWQGRARAIEDKLSDVLHERLTQRFVDRRTSLLMGRMRKGGDLIGVVNAAGEVLVEGEFVGNLVGFRFQADATDAPGGGTDARTATKVLNAAVLRALRSELPNRIRSLETDAADAFALTAEGRLSWQDAVVARLSAGHHVLYPRVVLQATELLDADAKERVRRRLVGWLESYVQGHLRPLFAVARGELSAAARGLLYQTAEALGSLDRSVARPQTSLLDDRDRAALRRLGLRIGREAVFFPLLLKPQAAALRGLLWSVHQGIAMPNLPPPGRVSVAVDPAIPPGFYPAIGFRVLGRRAVRVDIVERLAATAGRLSKQREEAAAAELTNLVGCTAADLPEILGALGYELCAAEGRALLRRRRRAKAKATAPRRPAKRRGGESPFARLKELWPQP
jgi:ATP-dependent RNA helicase SUPV3L1/SUV3